MEFRDRGSDQLTTTSAPEGNGLFGAHEIGDTNPWPGQYNILHIKGALARPGYQLRKLEQAPSIGGAAGGHASEINTAKLSHSSGHGCHKRRLIPLSTAWNGGEKWAIGFHQEAIFGDTAGTLVGWNCLGEGDRAAEADVKTELEESIHFFRGSAPAMHHAGWTTPL